jgi:hypothetical protein
MKLIQPMLAVLFVTLSATGVLAQEPSDARSWIGKYVGTVRVVSGAGPADPGTYELVIERVEGNKIFATSRIVFPSVPGTRTTALVGVVDGNSLSVQQVGGPGKGKYVRDGSTLTGNGYGTATTQIELKRVD